MIGQRASGNGHSGHCIYFANGRAITGTGIHEQIKKVVMKKIDGIFFIVRGYRHLFWRISPGGFSSLGNGQSGICQFDKNRAMGKRAFARLLNIRQRAEQALAFLQTGGQKRASGMPVGNTTL